jgi:hypothetical protein
MRGKWIALTAAVVIVAGGWTGGWFWLRGLVAGEMDRALADLSARGVEVTCPDRSITGWPFRLEIACTAPTARMPDGSTLSAGALSAIGVVDDPWLVRLALASPLEATAADGTRLDATFGSLAASLRHDGEKLVRLSVATEAIAADVTPAGAAPVRLTAATGEVHVRPVEGAPDDLDLAASITDATAAVGGADLMPAPTGAGVVAVLRQAALFGGDPEQLRRWAESGGEIGLTQAALEVGETRIEASGTAGVDADGAPEAAVTATATRIGWLTDQAKAGRPMPPALATLGSAFLLLGRKGEGDGDPRVLDLKVSGGAASANGLPLGTAPKLF